MKLMGFPGGISANAGEGFTPGLIEDPGRIGTGTMCGFAWKITWREEPLGYSPW